MGSLNSVNNHTVVIITSGITKNRKKVITLSRATSVSHGSLLVDESVPDCPYERIREVTRDSHESPRKGDYFFKIFLVIPRVMINRVGLFR